MRISRGICALLVIFTVLAIGSVSFAGVFVSVTVAPPVLPVYAQPACPGDGYIWTPGYWAYGPYGYYWVPGTWVMAPEPGLLWTPGYWAFGGGAYVWHAGYWGPTVGFYGGINYGFGYTGVGYGGGYWRDRHFYYNRRVNNVTITNVHVYNRTVVNERVVNRVSYNGGRGGIEARPSRDQERAEHERHFEATSSQMRQADMARSNRAMWASENHGRPSIAATQRAGEFNDHGQNGHFVPRPGNEGHNNMRTPMAAPRNMETPHNQMRESHPNVPHPPSGENRMNSPRMNQQEMRGQNVPHPSGQVHEQMRPSPRPVEQPRNLPRGGNGTPHPSSHVESAPHGNPHQNAAHQNPGHEQHESHPQESHGHGGGKGGRH